jgi:hypothetical protein
MSDPYDDDAPHSVHGRRYRLFAIGLAIVVLTFAAISIAVVASTSGR